MDHPVDTKQVKLRDEALLARLQHFLGEAPIEHGIRRLLALAEESVRLKAKLAVLPHTAVKLPTLEDAADLLLSVMELHHQDQVKDTAIDLRYPKWVIMLGAVGRVADHRELNAGEFAPAWLNRPAGVEAEPDVRHCERCHLPIPNARRGQSACCNKHGSGQDAHSDGCEAFAKIAPLVTEPAPGG